MTLNRPSNKRQHTTQNSKTSMCICSIQLSLSCISCHACHKCTDFCSMD